MERVHLRFYEELNDFLPRERRKREFEIAFRPRTSVKDLVEALGVPHTEIDLILVNGTSVDFGYIVGAGDRISVYPVFESLDITDVTRLRPVPLRNPRFVADTHLRKLARWLRLLGFDVLWFEDASDVELAEISASSDTRILLTRDRGLLKRSRITRGYCVRSTDPAEQAREVIERCDLRAMAAPFTRCMECNGSLSHVDAGEVAERVPGRVAKASNRFSRCEDCGRIYWRGSHYAKLRAIVETLLI